MIRLLLTASLLAAGLILHAQIPSMRTTLALLNLGPKEMDSFFVTHGFTLSQELNLEISQKKATPQKIWSFDPTGKGSSCKIALSAELPILSLRTPSNFIMAGWIQELKELGMRWVNTTAEDSLLLEEFELGAFKIRIRSGAGPNQTELQLEIEKISANSPSVRPVRRMSRRARIQ